MAQTSADRAWLKRLENIAKLVGGLVGLTAVVAIAGFLTERGRFGFAGLPMLGLDYFALVESGARALIKSLVVLFESPVRVFLLVAGLTVASGVAVAWNHPRVRRVAESPVACLLAQSICLAALGFALSGLLPIARLADPQERGRIRQDTDLFVRKLAQYESWSPSFVEEQTARRTYPADGLFALFRCFFEPRSRDALAEVSQPPWGLDFLRGWRRPALFSDRDDGWCPYWSPPVTGDDLVQLDSGHPIRRHRADRRNARKLYGWILLVCGFLVTATFLNIWWRAWLEDKCSKQPSSPHDEVPTEGTGPDASRGSGPAGASIPSSPESEGSVDAHEDHLQAQSGPGSPLPLGVPTTNSLGSGSAWFTRLKDALERAGNSAASAPQSMLKGVLGACRWAARQE
ncbi:MAG: hypothetical protein AAFU79_32355, partial [Myxococcota bacterium]